jgi:methyl-accepting chemotaxis protein
MLSWLDKISLKGKLQLLVGSALLVIVAIVAIVMGKTSEVRIGGETYDRIVNSKDIIADILPPPIFVVEAERSVQAMMADNNVATRQLYLAHIKALQNEFQQRVNYWATYQHLPVEVRQHLFGKVIPSADKYFSYALEKLPSALEDDKALQKHLLYLQDSFAAHLVEVKALVEASNAWTKDSQQNGLASGDAMDNILIMLAAGGILLLLGTGWIVIRNIMAQADSSGMINAISKSQAIVEFNLDGTVLTANDNFLNTLGYSLDEIKGKHHSLFVDPVYKQTAEYANFWNKLGRGEFDAGQYKRYGKGGKEVWIEASYNPIINTNGKPIKVVKFATNITEQKLQEVKNIEFANRAVALSVCQANVMLADNEMKILYMNAELEKMLRHREKEIRTILPSFDADKLIGTNVDQFHKSPAHQRGMIGSLKDVFKTDIKLSELTFGLIATPWIAADGRRLGTVVEWLDKTESLATQVKERQVANENARIKQALDSVTTNAMIADPDGNIVYMNQAVTGMLRNVESDLRKALPGFNVDKVLGANFDIFHKNPAHQRNLLAALKTVYKTQIEIAGKTFTLIANPVANSNGERIGTVVEWNDRTAEVAIEKEIDSMVEAASAGDFTRQIDLKGKEGFFKNLSAGLNKLVETTEVGINDVLRSLGAMSKGDLTTRITREYQGAFGQLKEDVNATNEKLTEIMGKIREAASTVQTGANEISQGVTELSVRSEEQASSLEETASSMEEMTSTVKQSAENAKQANELAVAARKKAQQGGEVVNRAMSSMEEINSSSKKIADIIGVIDEIAFQTNLLALNAAVEAARAGEQGRGFAVVAGEVRNLAQRAAAAAKEIKVLIRDSVQKVEDGSALVNESGGTLNEIVQAVENVSRMISEIASAAVEQTSGIEQVNTAVAQMDEMTQQNAALVEEASSASKAMADQAQQMNALMEFFTVGGAAVHSVASSHYAKTSSHSAPKKITSAKKAGGKSSAAVKPVSSDDDWQEF